MSSQGSGTRSIFSRSLVAKSLVAYEGDEGGAPRYGMLETIREFGQERLAASGQEAAARHRHAAWALALAERAGPQAKGPDAAVWLEALERDHANLRAALAWLVERGEGDLPDASGRRALVVLAGARALQRRSSLAGRRRSSLARRRRRKTGCGR